MKKDKKTLMNVPLARGNNNLASRAEQVTAKELVLTQISLRAAKNLRHRANSDRDVQGDAVSFLYCFCRKYGLFRKMTNPKLLQPKKASYNREFWFFPAPILLERP